MIFNISEEGKSPVEKRYFEGNLIYVKRDDLLSREFSGNKARKFYHYLIEDYPQIKSVVSYGSSQSNAMYSLSVLAKMRGWKFEYHVKHLSDYLKEHPHGNFKYALENGMQMIISEDEPKREEIESEETLFVEEGGRQSSAEVGLQKLAEEIDVWKAENEVAELNIFLPSGTGTTALYLQKHSQDRVYTVPCVGDGKYLKKQFLMLEEDENLHPYIVLPSRKRHFGKLYRESYNIWLKLQDEMGIEFDLLYDPYGWLTLLENPQIFEKPLLYIHQGGLIGNESMLARYKRKYGEDI